MKRCSKCQKRKDNSEFQINTQYRTLANGERKAYNICRKKCVECINKETNERMAKKYKTPEELRKVRLNRQRKSNLKRLYGITLEEFYSILEEQNNKCKICSVDIFMDAKNRNQKTCVDHCHKTGKVRGILCHKCNVAIGLLDDDISKIELVVNYLKSSEI